LLPRAAGRASLVPHGNQMGFDHRCSFVTALVALATLVFLSVSAAEARVGGSNSASRGLRSLLMPSTRATPRPPRSLDRLQQIGQPASRRGAKTTTRVIKRPGLIGGLVAGFLGAGLLGLLFGHGFFAGLGGIASLIGFLLQIVLFALVGWLAWSWWQRRSSPAFAGLSPRQLADAYDRPRSEMAAGMPASDGVDIGKGDYDTFERLLGEVQIAYGREDISALLARVTPEMLSRFDDDLARNASRGLVNQVRDVKLLQGDLAETWRDQGREYATVAMRFSLTNRMVERASERVIENGPDEVSEMWIFVRAPGGGWLLSAIQRA
jgi:predicted lipid-binding transport protein (Tim44 family)